MKRLVFFIVMSTLVSSFTGCGKNKNGPKSTPTSNSTKVNEYENMPSFKTVDPREVNSSEKIIYNTKHQVVYGNQVLDHQTIIDNLNKTIENKDFKDYLEKYNVKIEMDDNFKNNLIKLSSQINFNKLFTKNNEFISYAELNLKTKLEDFTLNMDFIYDIAIKETVRLGLTLNTKHDIGIPLPSELASLQEIKETLRKYKENYSQEDVSFDFGVKHLDNIKNKINVCITFDIKKSISNIGSGMCSIVELNSKNEIIATSTKFSLIINNHDFYNDLVALSGEFFGRLMLPTIDAQF